MQDGYIGRGLPSHRRLSPADGRIRPERISLAFASPSPSLRRSVCFCRVLLISVHRCGFSLRISLRIFTAHFDADDRGGLRQLLLLVLRSHTTERWCRQTHRQALQDGYIGRAAVARAAPPPSHPADDGTRPRALYAPKQSIGKRTHRQWCDRSGRPAAYHYRLAVAPPSLHSRSDAARSRRAHSGGPTLRSEIFGGSLVGFPGSRHRSHTFPLHVLIGSPSTIFERGCLETQFPGSPGRSHLAAVTSVFHPRRRQNSPRAPDAPQAALAHQ